MCAIAALSIDNAAYCKQLIHISANVPWATDMVDARRAGELVGAPRDVHYYRGGLPGALAERCARCHVCGNVMRARRLRVAHLRVSVGKRRYPKLARINAYSETVNLQSRNRDKITRNLICQFRNELFNQHFCIRGCKNRICLSQKQ